MTPGQSGVLGSVQRALRVLETVASVGDGITAKAVARRTGFKLPTTYHLLNTLVHEGYLVRLNNTRGYGLGYKISELHQRLADAIEVPPAVTDLLQDLHRQARAAVYYAVIRDGELVVVEVADSPLAPRARSLGVGFHEAPHATAFGKVLMAEMTPQQRRAYLAGTGLAQLTSHTVTRMADLEAELAVVRDRGLAQEVEEFVPDLACVGAPVRDADGRIRAAVALSVSASDFSSRQAELTHTVQLGAGRISRALIVHSG